MVGYNKDKLINFLSVLDNYDIGSAVTKPKIRASFYKIIMSDIDQIHAYKKEVVSILLVMAAIYSKKSSRNENKSYSTIAAEIISHELNRSLYGQQRLSSLLLRPAEVPAIQLLSMESISNSKFIDTIALLLIFLDSDLDDLFVSDGLLKKMIRDGLYMGDSFATIEEVINASNNYNS